MSVFDNIRELAELIRQAEERPSMKPYWMVHRYGRQSGPPVAVHHDYQDAYNEALRLTRKERDRFVILQAVTLVEPYEPLVVTVETIGDSFPPGPPEETEPTEAPCGYGCNDETVSSNCGVHAEPEPCPAQESGRMDDCTCGTPKREMPPWVAGSDVRKDHVSSGCTNPGCPCKETPSVPISASSACPCPACTTGTIEG